MPYINELATSVWAALRQTGAFTPYEDSFSGEVKFRNGTNFVGAERELREAVQGLDNEKIHSTMVKKGIQWLFNTRTVSQGGVWECQILTIRNVLTSVV